MDVAVVVEGISPNYIKWQPWNHYLEDLAKKNINVHTFYRDDDVFKKPFDAMLLHVYQDWLNKELFNRYHIMPLLEKYITYRYEFPDTVQIVLNHTDMGRRPYCIPYWRPGDPVLYRTPAYDRKELYPLSENQIWAYELLYGSACFNQDDNPRYLAGFIGSPNGPKGFREKVAIETSKVGIGVCESPRPYSNTEYNEIMSQCRIVVCPMGWGEQSQRHWDAWLSGKPVLTDRECDSVEMIPGVRLKEGVHYLVFDDPSDIPDIVSDWTRKSKLDDLHQIAQNGRKAAQSYDAINRMVEFLNRAINKDDMI